MSPKCLKSKKKKKKTFEWRKVRSIIFRRARKRARNQEEKRRRGKEEAKEKKILIQKAYCAQEVQHQSSWPREALRLQIFELVPDHKQISCRFNMARRMEMVRQIRHFPHHSQLNIFGNARLWKSWLFNLEKLDCLKDWRILHRDILFRMRAENCFDGIYTYWGMLSTRYVELAWFHSCYHRHSFYIS